jgi:hypothetical protein
VCDAVFTGLICNHVICLGGGYKGGPLGGLSHRVNFQEDVILAVIYS